MSPLFEDLTSLLTVDRDSSSRYRSSSSWKPRFAKHPTVANVGIHISGTITSQPMAAARIVRFDRS
jgi:hypothetical protein